MRTKVVLASVAVVLAVVAVTVWIEVQHGFSARDNPTALEAFVARKVRRTGIPSGARYQKNPFTATAEVLTEARRHFADHCAVCHGNDGSGGTTVGRNLYPKAPDMRVAETQDLTDGELYYIIHNGVRLTGMPAWGEAHGGEDEDSWKLVLFIRHLPKLTPEEERDMERYNPKSAADRAEEEEEKKFLEGGNLPNSSHRHHH